MSEQQIPKGKYHELNVSDIILPDDGNLRDPEPQGHLFGLKDSFETLGQLEAVIVSKIADKYYVVAGRRRIEAAKQAGLATIEAKVYDNIDRRTVLLMLAAENIHRRPFTGIEEAKLIQMLEEEKFHIKVIATKFNMSVDTIRRKRKLLDLPDDIQKMTTREHFKLPEHQALMLIGLSKSQQREASRQIAPMTGPVANEEEAKKIIDKLKGAKLDLQAPDPDDRHPSTAIAKKSRKAKGNPSSTRRAAKEQPTQGQKNAVPKTGKNSTGIINLGEINWDITGRAKLDTTLHRIDLAEGTAFIKIAGQEITLKSPATLMLTSDETNKIIIALGQAALKKQGKKELKTVSDKDIGLVCPKCGSKSGFSCEGDDKWKCLICGKLFKEKSKK